MEAAEIKLRCLELAILQCKSDGTYGNIEHVAEISTRFYNHITEADEPVPETRARFAPGAERGLRRAGPLGSREVRLSNRGTPPWAESRLACSHLVSHAAAVPGVGSMRCLS